MLVHLDIKNFTVVKHVELGLENGLTAITGETGAGKSIALDALGLCLGQRADSSVVRQDAQRAEVVAHFDIKKLGRVKDWLHEEMLSQEDNADECFIRRVISKEGRSKAFINGVVVTLAQVKYLGAMLVHIHGQNDHHQFLKADNQLSLVDGYAQHTTLLNKTQSSYQHYQSVSKKLRTLQKEQEQRLDRVNLLQYQVEELDAFAICEGEFEQMEANFKRLNSVQELIELAQESSYLIKDNESNNVLSMLYQAIGNIESKLDIDKGLNPSYDLLQSAVIQIQEAYDELSSYHASLENDPVQLQELEQRYASALELSRKHNTTPERLYAIHNNLADELTKLQGDEASLEELQENCQQALQDYRLAASALSDSRKKAAKRLSSELASSIQEMNLPHAIIDTQIGYDDNEAPQPLGNDHIAMLVSVNPGQAPDILEKVVSGGELARIGLAIQVIRSRDHSVPSMVFDEVDTGISGQTAAIVGKLLHSLGEQSQVICVTHLPQVAAQGHHQYFVTKLTDGKSTETKVLQLSKQERVNEIARLLAGDELTDTAIANARDLLKL